jgi:presequence protease
LVTCSSDGLPLFLKEFERSFDRMPEGFLEKKTWKFEFRGLNEAIATASKVQYVVKAGNFKSFKHKWSGKMHVLNQILTSDWLHNQVRVIGGAYGAFCSFAPNGNVTFSSYRDPNLQETLNIYDSTPLYLNKFEAEEPVMTRFIIGTISSLDKPRTPSQKGMIAMQYYFERTTPGMLREERLQVLGTTPADIRSMVKMVEDVLSQNIYCIYGSETKIKENKSLFSDIITIG